MLSINRLIATTCDTSFSLPKSLALMMYPSAAAMLRKPGDGKLAADHDNRHPGGDHPHLDQRTNADETNSLSAIGSSSVPTVVI